MKTIRFFYLFLLGTLALPAASDAQIADNDASISVLAVQCAVSSGFSADEYEDYCRRLAKTLSLLSSAQQTRVFGYLPMPGAASLGDSGPETNATAGSTEGSKEVPAESNALPASRPTSGANDVGAKQTAPDTTPTQANSLLDMVGRFNSMFDGTASNGPTKEAPLVSLEVGASVGTTSTTSTTATDLGNSTTVATTTSLPLASTSAPVAGTAASSGGSSNGPSPKTSGSWSSLMAWFQAAEAAYKSGTLSSFLRGGN